MAMLPGTQQPPARRGALGQRTLAALVPKLQSFRFQGGQMPGMGGLGQAPGSGLKPSTPVMPPPAPAGAGLSAGLVGPSPMAAKMAPKPGMPPAGPAAAPAPGVNTFGWKESDPSPLNGLSMPMFIKFLSQLAASGGGFEGVSGGAGSPGGASGAAAAGMSAGGGGGGFFG